MGNCAFKGKVRCAYKKGHEGFHCDGHFYYDRDGTRVIPVGMGPSHNQLLEYYLRKEGIYAPVDKQAVDGRTAQIKEAGIRQGPQVEAETLAFADFNEPADAHVGSAEGTDRGDNDAA